MLFYGTFPKCSSGNWRGCFRVVLVALFVPTSSMKRPNKGSNNTFSPFCLSTDGIVLLMQNVTLLIVKCGSFASCYRCHNFRIIPSVEFYFSHAKIESSDEHGMLGWFGFAGLWLLRFLLSIPNFAHLILPDSFSNPALEEERYEQPSRKHHPRMKNLYFMEHKWKLPYMWYTWLKRMSMKWVQKGIRRLLCAQLREKLTISNIANPRLIRIYLRLLIIYAFAVCWYFLMIRKRTCRE